MKILLSPAKTIQTTITYPDIETSVPVFIKESENLANKLKKFSAKKLKALYDVSSDIAEMNHHRFQNWVPSYTSHKDLLPCGFAFNGEVYRGLNIQNLSGEELQYLNSNLRILSGLYGLLKPFDLIYPYRLEMGTRIQLTPKIGNLYQFWNDKISLALNREEEHEIVNLASSEYFKAVQLKKLKANFITPVFKEFKNGEYKVLMTYAKHARGEMVNYAARKKITQSEQLKNFDSLGYSYDAKLSTPNEWVFTR
jgi:cytoplasmic iron level regulating protein YaaA (DUF328/UPF0246 family)